MEIPSSAWALTNVVNLALGSIKSPEHSGQLVEGLCCREYVSALSCILENLMPWIEKKRRSKQMRMRKNMMTIVLVFPSTIF